MKYLRKGRFTDEYKGMIKLIAEQLWTEQEVWKNKLITWEELVVDWLKDELPTESEWILYTTERSHYAMDINRYFRESGYPCILEGRKGLGIILRTHSEATYFYMKYRLNKRICAAKLSVKEGSEMNYLAYDNKDSYLNFTIYSAQSELYRMGIELEVNPSLTAEQRTELVTKVRENIILLEKKKIQD